MSKVKKIEKELVRDAEREQRVLKRKYPLLTGLTGAFGLVSLFYGFEHIIDKIPFLLDHPTLLVLIGLLCLFVSGQLYKKLD